MKTRRFLFSTAILSIVSLFFVNLAYGHYPVSPYAYVANNPVKYVDPDGRAIRVHDFVYDKLMTYDWKEHEGNWGFYNSDNALYAGTNEFIGQLSGALTGLMGGGKAGFDLVSGLANHSNIVTIQYYDRSVADQNNNIVGWNPTGINPKTGRIESVPTATGLHSNPMINLGHELGHIEYNWNGGETKTWFNMETAEGLDNIRISEIHTTHRENQMRSENGLPLRTHYGVDASGFGYGPRIIVPSTGASRYYNAAGVTNYRPIGRKVTPYLY